MPIKFINRFLKKNQYRKYKKNSFSQLGEDLIINFVFNGLGIFNIKYLDIGANHPIEINNTYFFYLNDASGVLIEPDPYYINELKNTRPNDLVLNIGLGKEKKLGADFYIMSVRGLNTFDKTQAMKIQNEGDYQIKEIIKVNINNINSIINNYFTYCPNLINIDTEGLDFIILESFDFNKFRPEIFCVETCEFAERGMQEKYDYIDQFMEKKGYFVFADTFVNTIYVDKEKWVNRKVPWLNH